MNEKYQVCPSVGTIDRNRGVDAADAKKVVARFTADGKRLKADAKARGFNMMLMKNGKTIKSFNK